MNEYELRDLVEQLNEMGAYCFSARLYGGLPVMVANHKCYPIVSLDFLREPSTCMITVTLGDDFVSMLTKIVDLVDPDLRNLVSKVCSSYTTLDFANKIGRAPAQFVADALGLPVAIDVLSDFSTGNCYIVSDQFLSIDKLFFGDSVATEYKSWIFDNAPSDFLRLCPNRSYMMIDFCYDNIKPCSELEWAVAMLVLNNGLPIRDFSSLRKILDKPGVIEYIAEHNPGLSFAEAISRSYSDNHVCLHIDKGMEVFAPFIGNYVKEKINLIEDVTSGIVSEENEYSW